MRERAHDQRHDVGRYSHRHLAEVIIESSKHEKGYHAHPSQVWRSVVESRTWLKGQASGGLMQHVTDGVSALQSTAS